MNQRLQRTHRTFGQLNLSRSNNFNFLRFFLALFVIFGHSFLLLPQSGLQDPITRLTRGQTTAGAWAVQGFFIISGFLIAGSWERKPNLAHFLKNRALRIYPGWIAALLVCTFVVAPLSGRMLDVLRHSQNTGMFFAQLLLHESASLPGVFTGNPVPNIVNGSLWTIPLEILCYFGAALCGLVGFKSAGNAHIKFTGNTRISSVSQTSASQKTGSSRWCVTLLFATGLLAVKFAPAALLRNLPWFGNLEALPFYGTCFLSGMMLYQYQDFVPVSWPLFLACVGAMVVAALRKQGMAIPFILCGSYALLFAAFLPIGSSRFGISLSQFGRRADLSYGIYLYAYPIQQLIIEYAGHQLTPLRLLFASLPPTFLLAALSWHFVERPFLGLKKLPLKKLPKRATAFRLVKNADAEEKGAEAQEAVLTAKESRAVPKK